VSKHASGTVAAALLRMHAGGTCTLSHSNQPQRFCFAASSADAST
jgi:hypothetical protein